MAFNGAPQWFLGQTSPRFTAQFIPLHTALKICPRLQRLEHRIPRLLRKAARQRIKALQPVEFGFTAGQQPHRGSALLLRHIAQQQAVMPADPDVGSERSGGPSSELEVQPEIADYFLREKADQVRIAREVGVVVWKDALGRGGPADVVIFL